ncbi:MAG: hypothetical protein IKH81_06745 [Clostridia bacterium]|nr:hypothetical protein [Clostridia bacterium]
MKKRGLQGLKENRVEIAGFVLIVFLFYLQMVGAGITTHDELSNIYRVRRGEFFSLLTWERWGMIVMGALPSWLHALCTSQWTYRLYTIGGLIASTCVFAVFLRKSAGKHLGWLFLFLFFLFAQIQQDHDGLLSFSFSYQLNTVYVFAGLILYQEYLQGRQRKHLVWSGVLYLLSAMAYETFILYGALFFLLDLFHWLDKKQLTVRNLFKDLVFHASLVTAYFISYLIVSRLSGVKNVDATLGTGMKAEEVLVTALKLAVGLFPLNYADRSFDYYLAAAVEPGAENLLGWFVIGLACVCIWRSVTGSGKLSGRRYLRITLFCGTGMILPCVLPAMTEKFIDWIYHKNIRSFGVSYYSYFFLIAWIAATVLFLYHLIPRTALKKGFLALCCAVIAVTGEFTLIGNRRQADAIHEVQDLYDLYAGLTETEYFADMEDDAQLYLPDYVGIHYQLDTLPEYANALLGKHLTGENEKEKLDPGRPVYEVRTDAERNVLYLYQDLPDGRTDEVLVYSLDGLAGCGITADRAEGLPLGPLSVDGETGTVYGANIVTGDLGIRGNSVVVSCEGMIRDSIRVYEDSTGYTNRLFSLTGVYDPEDWGRWAQKDFRIHLYHRRAGEIAEIYAALILPTKADGYVGVSCGNYYERLKAEETAIVQTLRIPMEEGDNTVIFYSGAPDMENTGDHRQLNFQILELILLTEKGERIRLLDFDGEDLD